jgi:hypothetical protein
VLSHFWFNALLLAAFFYAHSLFLMGISFMPTFLGMQLGRKIRAGSVFLWHAVKLITRGDLYFYTTGNFLFWFFVLKCVEQQAKGKLARTVPVVLQRNWLLKGKM